MAETAAVRIAQLERLAAWHRFNASHVDSEWVWEARLLAAEQLEERLPSSGAVVPQPLTMHAGPTDR